MNKLQNLLKPQLIAASLSAFLLLSPGTGYAQTVGETCTTPGQTQLSGDHQGLLACLAGVYQLMTTQVTSSSQCSNNSLAFENNQIMVCNGTDWKSNSLAATLTNAVAMFPGSGTFAGGAAIGTTTPQSCNGNSSIMLAGAQLYDDCGGNLVVSPGAESGIVHVESNLTVDATLSIGSQGWIRNLPNADDQNTNYGQLVISGDLDPVSNNYRSIGSGASTRWWGMWSNNEDFTNSPYISSDQRLKKNITDSDLGLDFVNTLRPVSYEWKDPKHDQQVHYGLIAQEVEKLLPANKNMSLVRAPDKNDPYYSVAYDELIAPLIKATQQLSAMVHEISLKTADSATEMHKVASRLDNYDAQITELKLENAKLKQQIAVMDARFNTLEKDGLHNAQPVPVVLQQQ